MWKSRFIKPYARSIAAIVKKERKNALDDQKKIFTYLIDKANNTFIGKELGFQDIKDHTEFQRLVPIRDYEGQRHYFDRILSGESSILWPGRPKYMTKTSGTTSGVKYIPITHESMPHHIMAARKTLMNYAAIGNNTKIFDGKVMFISGSPTLENVNGLKTGRLSGIVNHEIPWWLKTNQLPSYELNIIEEWEEKIDRIVDQTRAADLRLISGIPPWVQMYCERLLELTGKSSVIEVFPNLQLFMYGGVNYEPYRQVMNDLIGKEIDLLETFPASEGFIAYQDVLGSKELLLNTNGGIFFEFVPLHELDNDRPTRLSLSDVELGIDYAVILTSDAGLWAYDIGDTVRFTSLNPYKIIVSGRVTHFISAFGEHVISKEVEQAMIKTLELQGGILAEFTVAPRIIPSSPDEKPHHEWWIEFTTLPDNLEAFSKELDDQLRAQNAYYDDLITGQILQALKIRLLKSYSFREYMKSIGKLGGQNKVPRLSNDRRIADALERYLL